MNAEIIFWIAAAVVAYAYALYPLGLGIATTLRPRPVRRGPPPAGPVTVILAARDEEAALGRRLDELTGRLAAEGLDGEVIVVSDGSSDRTADVARAHPGPVRVLELVENRGKAAALTAGIEAARPGLIVFADARQVWAPDALRRLLENFHDPTVGAVSGDLQIEAAPGVLAGVGLYWRYEKWVRDREGRLHSTVGVTGAIAAARGALLRPIPPGTILDDVYWPLRVAMQGYRVVHDGRARAFDRLPERARDEFRRKVRTLGGNFQLIARLPAALLPWRNPIWFQFLSHKVLRLVVPWALLAILASASLAYPAAFRAQVAAYGLALAGTWRPLGSRSRLASAAASFLVLNAAAWMAFWVWAGGRSGRSWGKVRYGREAHPIRSRTGQRAVDDGDDS